MGGGKGGGGSSAPQFVGEPRANADYLSRYPDVASSYQGDPYGHYIQFGQFENRTYGIEPEIPSFEMPSFSSAGGFDQSAFDAEQDRLRQEQVRAQDLASIDNLWGSRMDAADQSISDVMGQIDRELSNARLRGLDYSVTDEQRQERVNNAFASYWSEGDESRLGGLTKKYGNPEQNSGLRGSIETDGGYEWNYDIIRGEKATDSGKITEGKKDIAGKRTSVNPPGWPDPNTKTSLTPPDSLFVEEETALGA